MTADDGSCNPNAYFRNRYRIESARLRGYDYTSAGMYHIVACTARRVRWFGEVDGDAVALSPAGLIVRDELARTPVVRPSVDIDAWVIMPDHLHVILALTSHTPAAARVGPYMPPGSVGAIINQIKGACTKRIRAAGAGHFAWQPRFYDCIIRSERQLHATRRYIAQNPVRWDSDSTDHPSLRRCSRVKPGGEPGANSAAAGVAPPAPAARRFAPRRGLRCPPVSRGAIVVVPPTQGAIASIRGDVTAEIASSLSSSQ